MTLHIFNPEHDIALASGLSNFTAPHAGRQLRHDMGFLPAFWAAADDFILVDDAEVARKAVRRKPVRSHLFVEKSQLGTLSVDHVEPWGWNAALRAFLLRQGVSGRIMPSETALEAIRQLSHRRTAVELLPKLRLPGTIGESFICESQGEVENLLERYGRVVVKAPWSSSGRGLRYLHETLGMPVAGWLHNVLQLQGAVIVEPYYNKVKDFGMEFYAEADGTIRYEGLSLFHTENGAYTGNVIATENEKENILSHYVPIRLLTEIQAMICSELAISFCGKYSGPFGVDMMICATHHEDAATAKGAFLLHPCVEINLRRTMGHVALAMNQLLNPTNDDEVRRIMRIEYSEQNYKLKLFK